MDGVLNILSPRKAQSRRFVMDKSPKLQTGNNHLELQIPSQGDIAIKNFLSLDLQEQQTVLAQNSSIISQIQSQSQNTLLFLSVQADNYQLSKLLLDNYANANHQNKFKETPLHKAIEIGNHKMINLLLENGANPNIQQEFGETPMHIAASKGDYKVLKLLLLFHADPLILSADGLSAEDYARERGYQKCVDVLAAARNNSPISLNKKNNFQLTNTNNTNYIHNKVESKDSCNSIKSEGILKKSVIADINDNNAGVFWNSHNLTSIANGMEKTPINHRRNKQIEYRVYSDNRAHIKNYYSGIDIPNFGLVSNNNNLNNNQNNQGSFTSYTNDVFNNILSSNKTNEDNYNPIANSNNDYDNNIFILNSKDNNEINNNEQNFTFSPGSMIHSKMPFSLADTYCTTSSKNVLYSKSIVKQEVYPFIDSSLPLITFHSYKNGIIVDSFTRESTIRVNLKKNNTLKSSKREENTYLEEYQLAEQTGGFKASTFNNGNNNINTNQLQTHNTLPNQERDLFDYLMKIHVEKYTTLLIKEGFDDVDMLINQMKGKKSLCDSDFKKIGINIPGDRARILIKLQLDAGVFGSRLNINIMNENDIFYYSSKDMNDYNQDPHLKELYTWFCEIKLGELFSNFFYNGYHSVDLMMMQMLSKNPITEDLLEHDLNVNKFGYRLRIMNKLFDESTNYLQKYRLNTVNNNVEFEKENDIKSSCRCYLF